MVHGRVPAVLRVGSAFPDPPFEVDGPTPSGFDVDLCTALAHELGVRVETHPYHGADFEGIFSGLGETIDLVVSGATVTDHRRTLARWCDPYVRSGQSLVVNTVATPGVHGVDDLAGMVLGVQRGNTSEPVARDLHRGGKIADVAVYPYDGILTALDDLHHGRIGAFMKLEPVMRWLTASRPDLDVVQTAITSESIAIAVPLDAVDLAESINAAQRRLVASGELARLGARWFADSDPAATGVVT